MNFNQDTPMKRTRSVIPSIELLESRIAPAGVITFSTDGKTATWSDVDGDKVTLKITKGQLEDSLFTTDQTPANGLIVTQLDLTDVKFKGTNVTVSASRDPLTGGDNTVNIGYIDATGLPLGAVSIKGDLGRIDAGDPNIVAKTPKAIASLTVHSMGMLDGTTLPAGVTQTSEITGKVGAVKVRGSVKGVLFNVSGDAAGSIDSLSLGGSLIGTDDADSGRFSTSGNIGAITIKGSIVGGSGQHSGSIEAGGGIKSLTVNGSILGGRSDTPSTDGTGVVRAELNIGNVTILGSIHGGTQQDSGLISAAGNMGIVKISGGIIGGAAGTSSGGLFVGGNVTSISVKGDVLGGAALDSGVIHVAGKAGAVTLLGALTGGAGEGSGSIWLGTDSTDLVKSLGIARDITGGSGENSGTVNLAAKVTTLKVGGSLRGGVGEGSGALVVDAAVKTATIVGDIAGNTGVDSGRLSSAAAIGSLSVGGNILGGTANGAGSIVSTEKFDKLSIAGSIIGGVLADTATADLVGSGLVQAGRVGALSVGGAILVGADFNATHELINNAAIRVQNDIGTLLVKGGIEGTAQTSAIITARGQAFLTLDQLTDVAFGKITIGASVRHASILAGYNTTADVTAADANPNAQIGMVAVTGDWIASDLVAGAAWNDNFGNGTDVKAAGVDNPDIVAQIAAISVTGQFIGTGNNPADRFGFVAQEIKMFKLGAAVVVPVTPPTPPAVPPPNLPAGNAISLNLGPGNDNDPNSLRYNLAGTLDVRVFEFA